MSRREFTDKTKFAAWQRCGGHCEIMWCKAKLAPGRFTYDHRIPDQLGGDPSLDNCQVICRECDRDKTGRDATDIARAKRRERKHAGIRKSRSITRWRRFNGDPVFAGRER